MQSPKPSLCSLVFPFTYLFVHETHIYKHWFARLIVCGMEETRVRETNTLPLAERQVCSSEMLFMWYVLGAGER